MVNTFNEDEIFIPEDKPFKPGALMFGIVTSVNAKNHTVMIEDLAERGFPWGPLSVMTVGAYDGGSENLPKEGTLVAWIPYSRKQGIVLGRLIESGQGAAGEKEYRIVWYSDGKGIKYDRETNTFTIVAAAIEMTAPSVKLGENPTEPAVLAETLGNFLDTFLQGLELLTVTCPSGGGPSSVPINVATFTALRAQIDTFKAQQVKVK